MSTALATRMDRVAADNMPKNLEAERTVLGAILLDDRIVFDATAILTPDDFFLDAHRRIYRKICEMADTVRKIDLVTLTAELERTKDLSQIGGVAYLASLTDGIPRRPAIDNYVDIIRESSRARLLLSTFVNSVCRLSEGERTEDVLAATQQDVIDAIHHARTGRGCDIKTAVRETLEKAHALRAMTTDFIGAPTGMDELDRLTTGFRADEFVIFGGRPGRGKTQYMTQAIIEQHRHGWIPGVFSAEVPRDQLLNRIACQIVTPRLKISDVRDNRMLSQAEYLRYCEGLADISGWDMFLDDTPRIHVKKLCAIARMWISRGCNCIWVDFLQKLRADGSNPFEVVTNIANDLWELARTTHVPVVALSQLKRRDDPDAKPTMEDLRGSGDIEQNANLIVLLGHEEMIIAKQRSGEADVSIPTWFDKEFGRFNYRSRAL